jgi:hypothetical protein
MVRDQMRLGVTVSCGFFDPRAMFASAHGQTYFFVDGHWDYYVDVNYMRGVRHGTLSAAQAQELADAMAWTWIRGGLQLWQVRPGPISHRDR